MKISLFQGILIGIFGLGALIGIFVFATYNGGGGGSRGIGTVVVWGTLPKDGINTTLAQLALADDSIKGVRYVEKNPVTLPTELASAIATDSAPDLVLASQEELYALSKFIQPIPNSTLPASTFTTTFVDEGGLFIAPKGSGYYGVPFLVDPLVLFWNNDILSSSGIAKAPANWEGLIGLVPSVTVLTPTKQITRGLIALGTYDNVHNARGILSALFLQAGVPMTKYSSNNMYAVDLGQSASEGKPLGEDVLRFYKLFADPTKVSYTWDTSLKDSQQAFQVGDLALYLGYASEARFFTSANLNLNYNVAPLPQRGNVANKSTYGLVYAFMIPRGASNASGAYQAAALMTKSAGQDIAARATGLAPATRTALSAPPSDLTAAVAYASALYSRGWLAPMPTDTDTVFSTMINNVVTGRLEPDAALTRAAGSLTSLLQK